MRDREGGFTLLISLLVLLALSIIAFTVAKTSFFQEKMAGAEVDLHRNFESAEAIVRAREAELAVMTENQFEQISPEDFANLTCGIVKVSAGLVAGQSGGARIETTFYVPPPENKFNWGCLETNNGISCTAGKVTICHVGSVPGSITAEDVANGTYDCKTGNTQTVSEDAWDENSAANGPEAHVGHVCDYAGVCEEGNNDGMSCRDRFGDVAKRLSWTQLWD